jgi:hypothetical protein
MFSAGTVGKEKNNGWSKKEPFHEPGRDRRKERTAVDAWREKLSLVAGDIKMRWQPEDRKRRIPASFWRCDTETVTELRPAEIGDEWRAYGEEERRRLRPVLLGHPEDLVRERAAWAFAAWGDAVGLIELVRDLHFLVRKLAM